MLTPRCLLLSLAAVGLLAACGTAPDSTINTFGPNRPVGGDTESSPSTGQDGFPNDDDSLGGDYEDNGHEGCGNGFDEDGDGLIDEGCPCVPGETQYCYVGDLAYGGVGACAWGTQTCESTGGSEFDSGAWGSCEGYGVPSEDVCDGVDNDCDGIVDKDCACEPGEKQPCGTNSGMCEYGEQTCDANGNWGACLGGLGASAEICNGLDDDCNGQIDEGLNCQCMPGMQEACGQSTGACSPGVRICDDEGNWSDCLGQVLPKPEVCNGIDDDCDGNVDPGCQCTVGETMPCNLYPNVGICHDGEMVCEPGGTWSVCKNAQGPVPEVCDDGLDNDCNGKVDEGCTITLSLEIVSLNNDAMYENCLYVRIDGGAAHFVGCNHDADIDGKQVNIQLPGPACYEVGLEMTIDDTHAVRTVAVGGAEDHRWQVTDQTPIQVAFEDGIDNDYNDFRFTVDMDRDYFGLKGRPIGCK